MKAKKDLMVLENLLSKYGKDKGLNKINEMKSENSVVVLSCGEYDTEIVPAVVFDNFNETKLRKYISYLLRDKYGYSDEYYDVTNWENKIVQTLMSGNRYTDDDSEIYISLDYVSVM